MTSFPGKTQADNDCICSDTFKRFDEFRTLESDCLEETGNVSMAPEAWGLIHDLELSYSVKAYSACFSLTCAMIEIHLRRKQNLKGDLSKMLKTVGLYSELEWLVSLRNDIMHGNPNPLIKYIRMPEDEAIAESLCIKAFKAMHTLAMRISSVQP